MTQVPDGTTNGNVVVTVGTEHSNGFPFRLAEVTISIDVDTVRMLPYDTVYFRDDRDRDYRHSRYLGSVGVNTEVAGCQSREFLFARTKPDELLGICEFCWHLPRSCLCSRRSDEERHGYSDSVDHGPLPSDTVYLSQV